MEKQLAVRLSRILVFGHGGRDARKLLYNQESPLVLDDPLSSVDVHTEAVIEESLARVLEGVTGLLVVHRPSTLALADRVALLDGGGIVTTGTHSDLMRSNDLYRALLSQEYERDAEKVTA